MTAWLRLAFVAVLLFLAVWVIVPPPTYATLVLAVGAPEVSAWLVLFGGVLAAFSVRDARRSRIALLTLLASASVVALAAVPFARFPSTERRFDDATREALGPDYLSSVPVPERERL